MFPIFVSQQESLRHRMDLNRAFVCRRGAMNSKRFSAEAKAVCMKAVELGRRSGVGVAEVSKRLGVSTGSLRRWCETTTGAADHPLGSGRLHEVVVRGPQEASGLTVTSRDGLEVSGVSLGELASVVQALRT